MTLATAPAIVNKSGVIGIDRAQFKDILYGVKEVVKANTGYVKAEQYYLGTRPEYFANIRYKLALARTGTTYKLNFSKTPVNAVVDRLVINSVTASDEATTAALRKVLDDNQFDLEAPEVHRRSCEYGDAYVLIWPNDDISDDEDDEDEDESRAAQQGAKEEAGEGNVSGIDIYYNDPRTMRLFYDDENPREKKFGIKRWKSGEVWRVNLYYKDRIEKWNTKKGARGDRAEDWVHYDDGNEWPIPNPFDAIPIFHFRTDRPYGVPEHIDAYGPQDAITKIVITHMATMDYHGFPQRWALMGGDLDDGESDLEDFGWDDPRDESGDAEETGESTAGSANRTTVRSEPGHLWFLKGVTKVGQFEAAPANVFLDPAEFYVRAMAQLTTTPLHYFDPQGGVPSGESLRVSEAPMVKKVNNRQMSFGSTWKDALEFVLMLMGYPNPAGTVKLSWEAAAAQNDLLTWDLAMYKRALGIPIRQILLEAGYTVQQLDEWGVPESKWAMPPTAPGPGGGPGANNPLQGLPPLSRANSSTL